MSSPALNSRHGSLHSPIKVALPQSILNDNAYRILYGNNAQAITNFVFNQTCLSSEEIAANDAFVDYVLRRERGPTVDYKNLAENLVILRQSLSRTPTGAAVVDFFTRLCGLRREWKKAALEYFSFDVYCRMVRAFFIDRTDAQFMQYLNYMSPSALEAWEYSCLFYSGPEQMQAFKNEWDRLFAHQDALCQQLSDMKRSVEMRTRFGQFREAIKIHAQLANQLNNAARMRKQSLHLTRNIVKQNNEDMIVSQMGQIGTLPMHPEMIQVVEQIHENQQQIYLTFPDKECAGDFYTDQEQEQAQAQTDAEDDT